MRRTGGFIHTNGMKMGKGDGVGRANEDGRMKSFQEDLGSRIRQRIAISSLYVPTMIQIFYEIKNVKNLQQSFKIFAKKYFINTRSCN